MDKIKRILGYTVIILGAISMLLPFVWMVCISVMTETQIFATSPNYLPLPPTAENYIHIFKNLPLTTFFINSLYVATMTTLLQICFSTMAGYGFAKAKFRHKNALFFLFIATMMVPPQVNIIPLFFVMRELGWINTYQALILPGVFGGFGIFLMKQWFTGLSKEIEDAARIDGCSFIKTFTHIALPLSLPAIITLGLFTFITTWNSFMWPLIITNSNRIVTLPVALAQFKSSFRETIQWGDLTACATILALPVIIIFLFGKKYFMNDILTGGLKE